MMRSTIAATALLISALLYSSSAEAGSSCDGFYPNGVEPQLSNPAARKDTAEVCYSRYVTVVSGVTRTPLWTAEILTAAEVRSATHMKRNDDFHVDPFLPAGMGSELSDYEHSGYDRGHLAPSGDMPDTTSQRESFSLANIAPQNATLNRGIWADIEYLTRGLALQSGRAYVVTGVIYEGESVKVLRGRVYVPTAFFKAIYLPDSGLTSAIVADNDNSGHWQEMSVEALERRAGYDVFPGLSQSLKIQRVNLLAPTQRARREDRKRLNGTSMIQQIFGVK